MPRPLGLSAPPKQRSAGAIPANPAHRRRTQAKTRPLMEAARARLAAEKGAAALEPHNISHALAGDATKLTDPYFPFEDAVDVWVRESDKSV